MTIDELIENFALFDDWEDRYRYLIDLGNRLPVMPQALKTEENKVRGCLSQVWMTLGWKEGKLSLQADSDAQIVKGLVAVLCIVFGEKTREEIAAIDIGALFSRLGLDQHLSPNRRNGFFAMTEKIRAFTHGS